MKPELIFVYNADSGVFNTLADLAHKIFSPQTYACNLCALTYSNTGMRQDWKKFIQALDFPVSFLHRDELLQQYGIDSVTLPAIFALDGETPQVWLNAAQLNACSTLSELKDLIHLTLTRSEPVPPGSY
jgi:hypothetical protein